MARGLLFRLAVSDDAGVLDEMTLAGVRYWGHHDNHPEAYRALAEAVAGDDGFDDAVIWVLEEDGAVVAFYDLRVRGDHVELLRMFQRVDRIGQGYGRMLWDHCVTQAASLADRLLIMSDPGATGFYEKMGATLERTQEVSPGFSLGVFWHDLIVAGTTGSGSSRP